jgi:hypothetical protein
MRTNTSGYRGVSWHKAARKWSATIRQDGVLHYLGLFDTPQKASAAYNRAAATLRPSIDPALERYKLLEAVRDLYRQHSFKALSTWFLYKQRGNLGARLRKADLRQPALLAELGLAVEYAAWRDSARTYRGVTKPKWSWNVAIATAKKIAEGEGDLPTVQQCRKIGLASLTSAVHNAGKTWDDLRSALGLQPSPRFYASRSGKRWRSRPEACFSNFLYARGVEHKKGERYPVEYSEQSGRHWGQYDLHFQTPTDQWINVEIWGDLDRVSDGRYGKTRALKEEWQADRPDFLGIQYLDCLSDARLTEILRPYIGVVEPFVFDKSTDHFIETAHWSNADELLISCKELAVEMPDGFFPSEDWLRRRGKYKNRPGKTYNSLAQRVNAWLGGTRNVRRLLGHGEASTTEWTPEYAIEAWRAFETKHGLTPSQCKGSAKRHSIPPEVRAEGGKIYEAAHRYGVIDAARNGRTARKIKWTKDYALAQWNAFYARHGRTPSECMSEMRRRTMPRPVTDEATRIYDAARRLGILEEARNMKILDCAVVNGPTDRTASVPI